MALRRKKALTLLVDGQPTATLVRTKVGPSLIQRLSVLIANLIRIGFRAGGAGLAATGIAHFVAPQPFESISKVAFPEDTRRWVYQNGFTELLLGLALAFRRTRIVGSLGGLAYIGFLISRVIGNANKG
ncbi:putative membrane protein [Mycobacteroides chelonae]|nr:putative membrane protein [Mycobacteroides chelonae]